MTVPRSNSDRLSPASVEHRDERLRVSFTDIPHTPRLFVDFVCNFAQVSEFYGPMQRSDRPLSAWAEDVAGRARWRRLLVDVLRDQNRRFGGDDVTQANIDRLADSGCVAIVTGQQAGLFTGPLLTLYKALTAITVAAELQRQGIAAVPVFWINSEDHDFDEVNHCGVVGRDGQWTEIRYAGAEEDLGKPVADLVLTGDIDRAIGELLAALPNSEFLPQIEADLRSSYRAGTRFVEGFARLLMRMLGGTGLILFDPSDARLKPALVPLFRQVLAQSRPLGAALRKQTEMLQNRGYRPPIHLTEDSTFLFFREQGKRYPLVWMGDRVGVKGGATTFTEQEVLDLIAEEPHRFSPNVALRPLVQDTLLPTLVYIGGPTEIAYFAQLTPLYPACDVIEPAIWPRASLTLVESRYAAMMAKYALRLTDLFAGADAARAVVVERSLKHDHLDLFNRAEEVVAEQLAHLRQILVEVDPTLDRPALKAIEKVRHQIASLRRHYIDARAHRDAILTQQIQRLTTILTPGRKLQERELNGFYFFARYGYSILERIRREIEVPSLDHRLIFL
ncbi:MAG TPA: bacillithiol biosynthesis cysteine-adding enzyme BshC [Blastocatellia bacterium]|nr:bacillithiol biosynthesis cysteine-adding enzyme BshC [Blastocatellia bacterium]